MQCSLREYTWKIYPESKLIAEAVLSGLPLHPSESDYLGTVPRNARRPGILAYFPCFSIGYRKVIITRNNAGSRPTVQLSSGRGRYFRYFTLFQKLVRTCLLRSIRKYVSLAAFRLILRVFHSLFFNTLTNGLANVKEIPQNRQSTAC